MSLTIAFRPGVNADVPYIKNSWLKSFRNGEGVRDIPNSVYYDYEEKILRYIIPRCSSTGSVIVAYQDLGPDAEWRDIVDASILGYIVCEEFDGALLVHMTYVRGFNKPGKVGGGQYRRRGIGTALIAEARRKLDLLNAPLVYTYRTEMCWREYEFRQHLRKLNATYVQYPKFSLLPSGWETGRVE